ncbi:dynein heavy chain [Ordospora colligata]|nr:dynein heavy chain [Ordospora colligata]
MHTNNPFLDAICNAESVFGGLSGGWWVLDAKGSISPYTSQPINKSSCIVKASSQGLLIFKGGHEFMHEAMSGFVEPAILSILRAEMPFVVHKEAHGLLRQLSSMLTRESESQDKHGAGTATSIREIEQIYEKYSCIADSGIEIEFVLSEDELSTVCKVCKVWVAEIKKLYESVNTRKKQTFAEEKMFWREFYMQMCYVFEVFRSKMFVFMCDVLRSSKKLVTLTTLHSLSSSNRYLDVGQKLNEFYHKMDFDRIYSAKSLVEFMNAFANVFIEITGSIQNQSRIVRRSVFTHMNGLIALVADRVLECESFEMIKCCEEMFSKCISNMKLLDEHIEDDATETQSLECMHIDDGNWMCAFQQIHMDFIEARDALAYLWIFKSIGKMIFGVHPSLNDPDGLEMHNHHINQNEEFKRMETEFYRLTSEMTLLFGISQDRIEFVDVCRETFKNRKFTRIDLRDYERLVSDSFNFICDQDLYFDINAFYTCFPWTNGKMNDIPISTMMENASGFSRLYKVMMFFKPLVCCSVFSERTFEKRLRMINHFRFLFEIDVIPVHGEFSRRIVYLFRLFGMYEEAWAIFKAFFGDEEQSIAQLSEYAKRKKALEMSIAHEIRQWLMKHPESYGIERNILDVVNSPEGQWRIEVRLDMHVVRLINEYMVLMSMDRIDVVGLYMAKSIIENMDVLVRIKPVYERLSSGCDVFHDILECITDDMDIFCNEIDAVFESLSKITNIEWKSVACRDLDEFEAKMLILEQKVYAYKFFVKKICRGGMKRVFSMHLDSGDMFSTDCTAYLRFFEFYDKDIVMRTIERSMKNVFIQYLENVIECLHKVDVRLFISKHKFMKIKNNGGLECSESAEETWTVIDGYTLSPGIDEYFKILERIFPSEEQYFFSKVFEKISAGDEVCVLIEKIIEKVVEGYERCVAVLNKCVIEELPSDLVTRFNVIAEMNECAKKLMNNTIPFFVFESVDVTKYLLMFETVCNEVSRYVDVMNGVVCENLEYDGCIREEDANNIDVLLLSVCNALCVKEYIESEDFKCIERLNNIVCEYELEKPRIGREEIERRKYNAVMNSEMMIERFMSNVPLDSILTKRLMLQNEMNLVCKEFEVLMMERDLDVFDRMLVCIEDRNLILRAEITNMNKVLRIMSTVMIYNDVDQWMKDIKSKRKDFERYSNIIRRYEHQLIDEIDVLEFNTFLESFVRITEDDLSNGEANTNVNRNRCCKWYEAFIEKINIYRDALEYFDDILSDGMKKYEYGKMCLGEFVRQFNRNEIEEKIHESKMEGEVRRYLNNALQRFGEVYLEISDVHELPRIMLLDEVESKLYGMLAEHESVMRFNTRGVLQDEVDVLNESLNGCIETICCVRQVYEGLQGLLNVFTSKELMLEAERYKRIKERFFYGLQNDGYNIQMAFQSKKINDSDEREKCIVAIKSLIPLQKEFVKMKEDIDELKKGLCKFLDMRRQNAPRLYFVSDENLIRALNDRLYYGEILRLTFNVDMMHQEGKMITGFVSGGEEIELTDEVSTEKDIDEFVMNFENEIQKKMRKSFDYCMYNQDLDGIETKVPAIVSELVDELRYFEGNNHGRSTPKIMLLDNEMKNNAGALRMYPKPIIFEGEVYVEAFSRRKYGFEYYPPTDIVFTPLVCRILCTIEVTLRKLSGLILYGRSGTGKTESVKYYCRTIGVPVFVFCCNAECSFKTLERVIRGACLVGMYVCFDEFNRLSAQIMSGVTELILGSKEKTKFFLTMNTGYKGRYELPRSLRVIFGETRVDVPDRKEVIEYYCGHESTRVYELICRLEYNVSKKAHYDFGLRAIRTIIRGVETNIAEWMARFYMSSFDSADRKMFLREFKSVFDKDFDRNLKYEDLLVHGLSCMRAALVFGANGVGKSMMIKKASKMRNSRCFYYNPKNMLSVFGGYNDTTGEWQDGIFLQDLRRCLCICSGDECWFVFDGPIESLWMEDFNSVLDMSKVLCLSSGERIRIPENFRFIFESVCIEEVTPATLTRVFIVYVERNCDVIENVMDMNEQHAMSGRCIRYDGRDVEKYEFVNLVGTRELIFYARCILDLARDERVFFIQGKEGVGKQALVREIFGERSVHVCACDLTVEKLMQMVDGERKRRANGEEEHEWRVVMYIYGMEKKSVNATEIVREYNEYGRIGGLKIVGLVIICGFSTYDGDMQESVNRVLNKVICVVMEEPKEIASVFRNILHNALRCTKHLNEFEKIMEIVMFVYKKMNVSIKKMVKFIRMLGEVLKDAWQIVDLIYFEAGMHFRRVDELREKIHEIFGSVPEEIGFDIESKKFGTYFRLKEISMVGSVLYRGCNLVVEGPKMSGKHWLVEECIKKLDVSVKMIEWMDEKVIDGQTVIFVEDSKLLDKQVVDESFVLKLQRLLRYSIDLEKLFLMIGDGQRNDCIEQIKSSFVDKNGVDIDLFFGENGFEQVSEAPEIDDIVVRHPDECKHCSVVSTKSYCKAIDFGMCFIRIAEEFRCQEVKRRKFLNDGIVKIEEFEREVILLRKESAVKKEGLEDLKKIIDVKLEKIAEEQLKMEEERGSIEFKKKEIDEFLALNVGRRRMVDEKIGYARESLEESNKGIREISKGSLSEIKAMNNPPEIIKNTVEAVFLLIEGQSRIERRIEWKRLVHYMKGEDFVAKVMNCGDVCVCIMLEKLMEDPGFTYERAMKASKACALLFSWIVAKHRHAKILQEIKPLEDEISEIECKIRSTQEQLNTEEKRLQAVEEMIDGMKREYMELECKLDDIKTEVEMIDMKAVQIDWVVQSLSDEIEKWRRNKYECPIVYMLSSNEWMLSHSRNVFVRDCDIARVIEGRRHVCTRVGDKSCRQVLMSSEEYGNDVVVYGCEVFDKEIYKALKRQMRNRRSVIMLVSETDRNVYAEYTYMCNREERFKVEEETNLEEMEENLIELITGNGGLDEIFEHKKKMDAARENKKQNACKKRMYAILNGVFDLKSKYFFERYAMRLSFRIYKEYIEKVMYMKVCELMGNENEILKLFENDTTGKVERTVREFAEYFYSWMGSRSMRRSLDVVKEIKEGLFDYTLMKASDEIIYAIEKEIDVSQTISAGCVESNIRIFEMLSERCTEEKIYFVKNIHFLGDVKKTGNCRFIFTIDEGQKHRLVDDTRFIFCKMDVSSEEIRRYVLSTARADDELVDFHMRMVNMNADLSIRDLILYAESRDECNEEYLKTLIYNCRIDS